MSHRTGRVIHDGRTVTQASGIDLDPADGPHGPVRFVMLHFDNANLSGGARLTVPLGYGIDVFTASSGSTFWSRPIDAATLPACVFFTAPLGWCIVKIASLGINAASRSVNGAGNAPGAASSRTTTQSVAGGGLEPTGGLPDATSSVTLKKRVTCPAGRVQSHAVA